MSPRRPSSWSARMDEAHAAHVVAEAHPGEGPARMQEARERVAFAARDRSPYDARSEHSWFMDKATTQRVGGDVHAEERLNRHRSWAEKQKRVVSTTTLSFISGVVLPPWVAEAASYGIRSTAPLASALLRLDLPPEGDAAFWAKVTTPASFTTGSQSAENAVSALPP